MERVSTLMDGELDSDEAAREITHVKQDAARRDAWNTYHAIGELMRGEHMPAAGSSPGFSRRLSEKLALEPTIVAPRLRLPATAKSRQTYALSVAASVAAIAVVGWVAMNMLNPDAAPATLAQAPAGKSAAVLQSLAAPSQREPVVMAPEHAHEYLLAHQGISPTTAIQGVTPYIRTVSNLDSEPGLR
jgi:sigma-E factor negative regulatory protein RseA